MTRSTAGESAKKEKNMAILAYEIISPFSRKEDALKRSKLFYPVMKLPIVSKCNILPRCSANPEHHGQVNTT
jgi:hypothetical protein